MSMSVSSMKSKILNAMASLGFNITPGSDTRDGIDWVDRLAEAIAQGVYEEITQNAVVQTTSGAPDGEHTGIVT